MVDQVKQKIKKMHEELSDVKDQAQEIEEDSETREKQNKDYEEDIRVLEGKLTVLEDDLDAAENTGATEIRTLENDFQEWDKRAAAAENRVRTLETDRDKLSSQLNDILNQKEKIEQDLKDMDDVLG
eukprot:m.306615 g.306615  ORF g.306615 m.306615 type:complete len:127 (+) comp41405_c0_seq1:85-465(+)